MISALAALCVGCSLSNPEDSSDPSWSLDPVEDASRDGGRDDEPGSACPPPQDLPLDPSLARLKVTPVMAALRPAQSCDDLAKWRVRHQIEAFLARYHFYQPYYCYEPSTNNWTGNNSTNNVGGAVDMAAEPEEPGELPTDYSMTNVQERSVDEADIIKTDGQHIYMVEGNTLRIFKSWPPVEASHVKDIVVGRANNMKLLLAQDTLILFYDQYNNTTNINIYDLSADPLDPRRKHTISLDGEAAHIRMVKGRVHLITRQRLEYDYLLDRLMVPHAVPQSINTSYQEPRREQSRHRLYQALDSLTAQVDARSLLPSASIKVPGAAAVSVPLYDDCAGNILLNDALPVDAQLVHMVSFDPADPHGIKALGATLDPELFYTSPDRLYISADSGTSHYAGASISGKTQLYSFGLGRAEGASYVAHGVARGDVLPDLAMSERGGRLRVFTNAFGATRLSIFEEQAGNLDLVGELDNIAPGERATAARMSGDRLYVLTAKGSGITSPALPPEHPEFIPLEDPLFVIDAADPTAPKLLGELDFPGFSAYVHPMGPDHLLSLGRDESLRLRLQVFDISDTSQPIIAHEHTIERADHIHLSEALNDRLRFVYHAARGLLALPVVEQSTITRATTFNGHKLFHVTEDGIRPLGDVHHGALGGACTPERCDAPPIRVSLFIEDYLYSLSASGLMIHDVGAEPVAQTRAVPFIP